jgi:hypothetical protein
MSAVFDRYLKETLLNLAPRTQRDYAEYIENLRQSFSEASPQEVTANSIFDYRAARGSNASWTWRITGQREGDLLKLPNRDPTVYTQDGIVFWPGKSKRRHPCHGKMIESSKTVIVEWSPELEAVLKRLRKLGPDASEVGERRGGRARG